MSKGKLNMDKIKKKQEQLNKGGQDFRFWSPEAGRNVIRILPPKDGSDIFWSEGKVHFQVGGTMVSCLSNWGEECPVCERVEELKKSKSKSDKKLSDSMWPKTRAYMNIINRESEEEEVEVMGCGPGILKDVINMVCDPDYGDITDFNEGRDVIITKTGKGLKTEYKVMGKPKVSVASSNLSEEEVQGAMVDLDELFVKKEYDELVGMLEGGDSEEDEGEDDEDDEDICPECGEPIDECACVDEEPEDEEDDEPKNKKGKKDSLKDEIRKKIDQKSAKKGGKK